ncbi:MAG: DUF308 domain-containing protein [Candidatus Thorarchaeota archaeon]
MSISEGVELYPKGLRGLDIILGLVSLVLGFWIMLDFSLVPLTALFLMSISLIALGFARLAKAISVKELSVLSRFLNVMAGVLAIFMALLVFVFSSLAIELLILLVALGLLVIGIVRVSVGLLEEEVPGWGRILHFVVGLMTLVIALFALFFSTIGFYVLAVVLAVSFISNGIARVIAGATGQLR